MEFKAGDKVSFLNEPLHGIVLSVLNDSHVVVECNGIEMDVSSREIIKISFIPKVESKHLFPIKKEDKKDGYDAEAHSPIKRKKDGKKI